MSRINFKFLLFVFWTVYIFIGCSPKDHIKYFQCKATNKLIEKKHTVQIDSILLGKIPSSYVGEFHLIDDSIFFIDELFCKVFIFNTEGKLLETNLGSGGGPFKFAANRIVGFSKLKNGNYLFLGPSFDCHIHNKNWERIKTFRLRYLDKLDNQDANPDPARTDTYDIDYEKHLNIREVGDYLFIPIESTFDNFNPITTKSYYTKSRIFFKVNKETGDIEAIEGRRSPYYLKFNFIGQFSWFCFDTSEDDRIFVGFEPDSLIYEYDAGMKNIRTYGFAGKNMDTDYLESRDFEHVGRNLKKQRAEKGYYNSLKYIDETKMLFRGYQKGKHSAVDGLQIYRDGAFVADIDVPKGLKIIGYKKPWYYSSGIINELNEEIKIYKLKIDEN